MNSVILKYYEYQSIREEPKFSLSVAAAKLNAILARLQDMSVVGEICALVSDREHAELRPYVEGLPEGQFLPFSRSRDCSWINSSEPVLFLDEQAFYATKKIISGVIACSERTGIAGWEDSASLLYSYNYAAFCDLFVAPGEDVFPLFSKVTSFEQLRESVLAERKAKRLSIDVPELRSVYRCATQLNPIPYHFALETTSRCDSRCIMCPFHSPDPEIAKGKVYLGTGGEDMPVGAFKGIVDEISAMPWKYLPNHRKPMVTAQLRGEPLLAHGFQAMCRHVKEQGIRLSFSTNGNRLGKDGMIEFLLDIGLDEIIISIDPDRKSFNRIRPQLNYDTVLTNIMELRRLRDARGLRIPTIYTKTIFLKDVAHADMKETASRFLKFADYVGFAYENFEDYQSQNKGYSKYFFTPIRTESLPCLLISDVGIVHSNGNIQNCYGDTFTSLGNCFSSGLVKTLLDAPFRKEILNQQSSGLIDHPTCRACTSWLAQYNRTRRDSGYLIQENPILCYWSADPKKNEFLPELWKRLTGFFHRRKCP